MVRQGCGCGAGELEELAAADSRSLAGADVRDLVTGLGAAPLDVALGLVHMRLTPPDLHLQCTTTCGDCQAGPRRVQ